MRITSKNILSEEQIKKKYLNVSKLNIIWVGNIEARKMPNLLIDSLRRIKHDNILVTCIGGGRTKYFESCGLEFVKSVGQISRSEVEKYWENAHLHIITSALEANTTVLFEAMEHCKK